MSDLYRRAVLDLSGRIDRLARRRLPDRTAADAAANHVLERLQANDFARVRAHDGRAGLSTNLTTVAANLIEDYARQRFGRGTIPVWVRSRGPLWERLQWDQCGYGREAPCPESSS